MSLKGDDDPFHGTGLTIEQLSGLSAEEQLQELARPWQRGFHRDSLLSYVQGMAEKGQFGPSTLAALSHFMLLVCDDFDGWSAYGLSFFECIINCVDGIVQVLSITITAMPARPWNVLQNLAICVPLMNDLFERGLEKALNKSMENWVDVPESRAALDFVNAIVGLAEFSDFVRPPTIVRLLGGWRRQPRPLEIKARALGLLAKVSHRARFRDLCHSRLALDCILEVIGLEDGFCVEAALKFCIRFAGFGGHAIAELKDMRVDEQLPRVFELFPTCRKLVSELSGSLSIASQGG
jgi:hypothetical protein